MRVGRSGTRAKATPMRENIRGCVVATPSPTTDWPANQWMTARPRSASRSKRVPALVVGTVFVVVAGLYVGTVARDLVLVPDAAVYAHLADNLLAHGAYRTNAGPYALVPPGFPIVLAGVFALVGHNWLLLNVMMALVALTTICGFFAYVRRVGSTSTALCLTVVLALCLPFYWVSRHLLTDIPFACAMMGCCYALHRWQWDGQPRRWLALAVALAAVGVSLRSVGLILPMVLAVTLCLQGVVRRRLAHAVSRAALVAVLASAPMLLFVARNATLADGAVRRPPFGYMVQLAAGGDSEGFTALFSAKWLQLRLTTRSLLADATNVDAFRSLPGPATAPLAAMLLIPGGLILLLRRRDPLVCFLVLYLPVIVTIGPLSWHTTWRYLMPIMPAVILVIWQSLDWLVSRWPGRVSPSLRPWAAGVALATVSGLAGYAEWVVEVRSFLDRDGHVYVAVDSARETARWLTDSVPAGEPVVSAGCAPFLLTDRPGVLLPRLPDGQAFVDFAQKHAMRWVVSWKPFPSHQAVADAVAHHPETVTVRFENTHWVVCEVAAPPNLAVDAG